MNNKEINKFYNDLLIYDATYHELFYESTVNKSYRYLNNKLEDINIEYIKGLGITLNENEKSYFASTNNFEKITEVINEIGIKFKKRDIKPITLEIIKAPKKEKDHKKMDDLAKKDLMNKINNYIRNYDKRINQVIISFEENNQNVKIASENKLIIESRFRTRLSFTIFASNGKETVNGSYLTGFADDYSFINEEKLIKEITNTLDDTLEKFNCVSFAGGNLPVVIGPGFGSVIFHEACGHAMESYSIVNKTSILTNKLNTQIASDKVTIIDDGSKDNLFGTTYYDDEGEKTKENILIENGILKNYLTNKVDGTLLKSKSTASARRQSYKSKATSRMNNTYLKPGNDKISDMIKTIKYGLYAKTMGGGSVSPTTGEFNFVVNFGYIIENGKITKPVKNISLIGSALEILNNVEMVSDNLKFSTGYCGAASGSVPVIIGQPTIKVSNILVGGSINE